MPKGKYHRSLIRRQLKKAGVRPGSIVYTGEKPQEVTSIVCIVYNEHEVKIHEVAHVDELEKLSEDHKDSKIWIRITGLSDIDILARLSVMFSIHPLVMEDIANTNIRPKHDTFPDFDFIAFKLLLPQKVDFDGRAVVRFDTEQLSLVIRNHVLLSFHETATVRFITILERIQVAESRHRTFSVDYLAYSLIDTTVDHYMLGLEQIGEQLEDIDSGVLDTSNPNFRHYIHETRREIILARKHILPLREAIWSIYRSENSRFRPEIRPFVRDVLDHLTSIIDTLEDSRDILATLSETYMSTLSLRMNEVMKLLTIISTVFMPLTFIVGVYGMNFSPEVSPWNMPELTWQYGYPAVWGLMIVVTLCMIGYILRRKWL